MMLKHDDVLSFHSMTDKDVMSVYELERECFSVPWSIKSISLYGKLGFEKIGIRKNFYENPREDALIMTKYL